MTLIAPSILSADFGNLLQEVQAVCEAGADWIHVDVMDGVYVPNISIGFPVLRALKGKVSKPLDVHLMITEPERYLKEFADAGADTLVIHEESTVHLHRSIAVIKEMGIKAGVALNPHTPLSVLEYILNDLDIVMLMSVNPGYGGQKFISSVLGKISDLKEMMARKGATNLIEVDGGVTELNAGALVRAGADVLVSGSAVFGKTDYKAAIAALRASV
jgi:ribulose-phosphate 3-epimerase